MRLHLLFFRLILPDRALQLPIVPKTSPEKPLPEEEKDDAEDAQAVVNRMKGQVNEMRRRSMAREARVSLVSSPVRPRPSIGPSAAATPIRVTYYSGGDDDMLVDVKDEPEVPAVPVAPVPQSQSRSSRLYPDIPMIDFSSPRKARESAAAASLPAVATTPHLSGVRDLFRPGHAAPEMATPALKGVRGLFNLPKPPIVPSTPTLEAVAQLFAPKVEDAPVVKPRSVRLAISGSSDEVPVSDATDEETRASKPTTKVSRARPAATKSTTATTSGSRIARPTRTQAVRSSEVEDSSETNIPAAAATKTTRTARTTKAAVPPVAGTAARGTRRANSQDPLSSSEGVKPVAAARAIKRKASASTASADKENDESSAQESSSAALKAATMRRRVASKPTGVETGSSSDAASRMTRSRARK